MKPLQSFHSVFVISHALQRHRTQLSRGSNLNREWSAKVERHDNGFETKSLKYSSHCLDFSAVLYWSIVYNSENKIIKSSLYNL